MNKVLERIDFTCLYFPHDVRVNSIILYNVSNDKRIQPENKFAVTRRARRDDCEIENQ